MSESLFMLDTNTVSYLLRSQNKAIQLRLKQHGVTGLCISAITEAELRFSLGKNPSSIKLSKLVNEFLSRVDSLPWATEAARCYAELRTHSRAHGFALSNMDMLIGVHSIAVGATLITNDKVFSHLSEWIKLENWVGS
jgi:tRNA(fMet)-specific endonuclease VapC